MRLTMTLSQTLSEYVCAGFSGIWLETTEPDEAQKEIFKLCSDRKWQGLTWDMAQGMPSNNGKGDPLAPLNELAKLVDSAHPEPVLLLLHNYHQFLKSPMVLQAAINAITQGKAHAHHLVVLSPLVQIPPELEKLFVILDHPLPTPNELHAIAEELTVDSKTEAYGPAVKAAPGLTRYQAEGAFALSLARHNSLQPDVIWELKAQILKNSGLLNLHRGKETLKDLGGMHALKIFCQRALDSNPAGPRPRGILLLGVPGTGKSAFAKALGNAVSRPTLLLDIGSLMGSLVGQTEANLRQALRIADAMSPCILFVDEIEKALSGVGSNGDSGVSTRVFGTLLTWLNDHTSDVFFIGTCNDISKLPPEFARAERFDGIFFLDLPDTQERRTIWRMYRDAYSRTDTEETVEDTGWTGAEIKACCRLAALLDTSLAEAAKNIVPVSKTAADKIDDLRQWAESRCLSASQPGVYRTKKPTIEPSKRRSIVRA
jgi:hypothetical protein